MSTAQPSRVASISPSSAAAAGHHPHGRHRHGVDDHRTDRQRGPVAPEQPVRRGEDVEQRRPGMEPAVTGERPEGGRPMAQVPRQHLGRRQVGGEDDVAAQHVDGEDHQRHQREADGDRGQHVAAGGRHGARAGDVGSVECGSDGPHERAIVRHPASRGPGHRRMSRLAGRRGVSPCGGRRPCPPRPRRRAPADPGHAGPPGPRPRRGRRPRRRPTAARPAGRASP